MATRSLPSIPVEEFARRRQKARTALRGGVGVIFAGEHDAHLPTPFRPHPHFEYLTGVVDEPDAVLVLDSKGPVEARRDMLFLRPLNPELEKWDGFRAELGTDLRERTGFKALFRTTHLPRFLADIARRAKTLSCLHPFAWHTQPVSPDLALFRQLAERIPGIEIDDCTDALATLRGTKSTAEVKMIQHAVDITRGGFDAVFASIEPGQSEFDVQETIEHTYRTSGSRGPAYGTIAGSGFNSTVLHYAANCETLQDGDLICIDSGAQFGGYGADITRTLPLNGPFTKRQRAIYDVVLKALTAPTRAAAPGVTLGKLDALARAVITKAGYGDYFIHSIGHHLGLETHDVTPDGALKPGAVITIEPGIYIPEENLGVRLEDDVLITKNGYRNLSAKIPRTAAEIEQVMKR